MSGCTEQLLLTFRGHEGLVVKGAPAHWVQLSCHDITPEVSLAVITVATEAQQEQLATGGDDGGHPVRVGAALISHFKLHARLEAALQAELHLEGTTQNILNIALNLTKTIWDKE